MADLKAKHENIKKMIRALELSIARLNRATQEDVPFIQDSLVARFKILIESTWKNIALYLQTQDFEDVPSSPRGVIEFAYETKFLSQQERDDFLKYLSLRNLASHLYDQPQYALVADAAPSALALVKELLTRMEIK